MKRSKKLSVLFILLFSVSACQKMDEQGYIESIKAEVQNQEYGIAEIKVKNGIKEYPESWQLRNLLGQLYFESGDLLEAEKEYIRSYQLGNESGQIVVNLAEIFLIQDKIQETLDITSDEIVFPEDYQSAKVLFNGIALFRDNKSASAKIKFRENNEIVDKYAFLSNAYINLIDNNFDALLNNVEKALNIDEYFYEALMLKTQVSLNKKNYTSAENALNKINNLPFKTLLGKYYYAQLLLMQNKFDDVVTETTLMLEDNPNLPGILSLQGEALFSLGQFEEAKLSLEKAIQSGDKKSQPLFIAGVVNYYLGNFEQAAKHLNRIDIKELPDLANVISELKLALEKKFQADAGNSNHEQDVNINILIAASMLNVGQLEQAAKLVSNIKATDNMSETEQISLGAIKVKVGDKTGINILKSLAIGESSSSAGRIAYLNGLAESDLTQEAMDYFTDAMNSGKANTAELLNMIEVMLPKISTEQLMTLFGLIPNQDDSDKVVLAKIISLTKIEESDLAAEVILALTKAEYETVARGSSILFRSGYLSDPISLLLFELLETNPQSIAIKQALADKYFAQKEPAEVIKQLSGIDYGLLPEYYANLLADSYAVSGRIEEELELRKFIYTKTGNSLSQLKLISTLQQLNKHKEAITIAEASENSQQSESMNLMLVNSYVEIGDFVRAQLAFDKLQVNTQRLSEAQILLSDIQVNGGNYSAAIANLEKLYERSKQKAVLGKLLAIFMTLKEYDKMESLLIDYLAEDSEDTSSRELLASYFMQTDMKKAVFHLAQLRQQNPDNMVYLNNYTWALLSTGNVSEAYPLAVKIMDASNIVNAVYYDTAAQVFEKNDDYDRAVQAYQKAFEIQPVPRYMDKAEELKALR